MSGGDRGGGLRAATLTVLIALLTAVGHEAGGGALPDLALAVVLLPLLAAVLTVIARRCATLTSATLTLGVGQFVLHHLLVALHPSHHEVGPAVLTGTGMVAMHVLATLVTAVVVWHADRAVAAVRAALRRIVPRRPRLLPAAAPLFVAAVPAPAVAACLVRACTAPVVRRGPPVGC
jgi:hypothetical protein